MSYQNRPGSGALFSNNRKDKDTHPDYRGDVCLPDGTVMSIAGWLKSGRDGRKFISLKIEEPRDKKTDDFRSRDAAGVSRNDRDDPFSDEVPF